MLHRPYTQIFLTGNVFKLVVLHTVLHYLAVIVLELVSRNVWIIMLMLKRNRLIGFVLIDVGLHLHSITPII